VRSADIGAVVQDKVGSRYRQHLLFEVMGKSNYDGSPASDNLAFYFV
jgi:hypothetical protein